MSGFTGTYKVRFAHCDPAGILYYPRYFELIDAAVEDWTEAVLGIGRHEMHLARRLGMPLVDVRAAFDKASRLDDLLEIGVAVAEVGHASVTLAVEIGCKGECRVRAWLKQVLIDLDAMGSIAWPDEWRRRLGEGRQA